MASALLDRFQALRLAATDSDPSMEGHRMSSVGVPALDGQFSDPTRELREGDEPFFSAFLMLHHGGNWEAAQSP